MQVNIGTLGKELLNSVGFMAGQAVQHDVDFPPCDFQCHQLSEEADNSAVVYRGQPGQHGPNAGIERGEQRERSVPVILKAVSFGALGRQQQDPIESVERLNPVLFIEAKHCRMLWRVHVKSKYVCSSKNSVMNRG